VAAYNDFSYDYQDIMLISSLNIAFSQTAVAIPNECKKRGIKVIGQYCGEVDNLYAYADLIVAISPQLYLFAKEKYKDTPVIFLPESIDTNYFQPSEHPVNRFVPGWAGGAHKEIKRTRLFEKLKYPISVKSEHGKQFFHKGRTQTPMKEWYKTIDCFINMSETECMPRVLLEAMASGLPIISTNVGGVRLLIPDEYLTPVFPEDKCVEETNKLLAAFSQSYELREAMGRINRAWCERLWSWENNMPIWDEVFYYLHKGNIDKVLEIGDSCIGSFEKFFEPCEEYTKQIARFSKTRYEVKPIVKPTVFDHPSVNLIKDLSQCGCDYWLAGNTCLDTINHQRLVTKPGSIYIGVRTSLIQRQIGLFLEQKGAKDHKGIYYLNNLTINIVVEPVSNLKTMILYGQPVPVPMPVVPYLCERFGENWKSL
jgi:hypothetical protein